LVNDAHWRLFTAKRDAINNEIQRLQDLRDTDSLRRPEVTYDSLANANRSLATDVKQQVEIQIKYAGYIARDTQQIQRFKSLEDKQIPHWMDYSRIAALRFESRQKLSRFRPDSIGQASRISGVTPADIAILLVWLKRAATAAQ
jgi:tRNA uridine 5-carboxymethylaminomethyl modification enzyme